HHTLPAPAAAASTSRTASIEETLSSKRVAVQGTCLLAGDTRPGRGDSGARKSGNLLTPRLALLVLIPNNVRDTEDWELLPTTRIVRDEPRIAMWFGVLALIAWFSVAGALVSEAMIAVAFGAMFSVL